MRIVNAVLVSRPVGHRNGVKWWQYDISKWLIFSSSLVGLTKNLKRCPEFAIQKAQLAMQFKRAESQVAVRQADVAALKAMITRKFDMFTTPLEEWARLKEERYAEKKGGLLQRWQDATFRDRFREMEYRLKMQRKREHGLTRHA